MDMFHCCRWYAICLLLLTGSAPLVEPSSCADRNGVNREGSDVVITTAVCYGDGRVDYGWRTQNGDPIYRSQIEYSCYNVHEESTNETIVLRGWGGPYEGTDDSFTVADWSVNTTCILSGCYEMEVVPFINYRRRLLSPIECSAPVVVLTSTSLNMGPVTSEVLETTQSTSSPRGLATSTVAQQYDTLEDGKDDISVNDSDIYVIAAVFLAFLLALAVVTIFVALHIKRSKNKRFRLPTLDPTKLTVDKNAQLVDVHTPRPVEPDSVTTYELLDILHFEESPQQKHQTRTPEMTVVTTDTSSILGPPSDTEYITEMSYDLMSMMESGGSCATPSLSETSRKLVETVDVQTDRDCDSVGSEGKASVHDDNTGATSQGEDISFPYFSRPSPQLSGCIPAPGYVGLENHTNMVWSSLPGTQD